MQTTFILPEPSEETPAPDKKPRKSKKTEGAIPSD